MSKLPSARLALVTLSLFTLAACGGSSGASLSASNPNFFRGSVSDGAMTGAFNSSGYNKTQVRNLLTATCDGRLSGFATQSRSDGLVAFTATCPTWKSGARAVEYERTNGSNVLIEITGSDGSGNLYFDRIETAI